jgi:predicted Zn finger-like uncharacterized protein
MNVSCPDCRSIFRVDPAKVPPAGVRARCSVCSGVISIPAPTGQNTPASGNPTASGGSIESSQGRGRSPAPDQGGWDAAPVGNPSQGSSPAQSTQRAAPPPPPPQMRSSEVSAAPRQRPESIDHTTAAATATPPSPSSGLPEFASPQPAPFKPPLAPPFTPSSGPPFVPPATRQALPTPTAPTPPSAAPAPSDGGARRPLNPFLSKDPNQRAKRLARALVSDIITYHPAKHAEGLRDGTLKQLFREEIKKSFEEYIAQVGQQLAESTTYFQEALNEVLGAGKKIF